MPTYTSLNILEVTRQNDTNILQIYRGSHKASLSVWLAFQIGCFVEGNRKHMSWQSLWGNVV